MDDTITPKQLFLNRREFLKKAGISLMGLGLAACIPGTEKGNSTAQPAEPLSDTLTTKEKALSFNNFYEFSFSKSDVAQNAKNFKTEPWVLSVSGLVDKPLSFSIHDLIAKFKPVETVQRFRCVEAWSMVLPWVAFPLKDLIAEAAPQSSAKYVKFTTASHPGEMPGMRSAPGFPWPYTEGLRLDEAMHPLALLATGLYGEPLAVQNGAPVRLVTSWKYGFKSIKSIEKIELVAEQPATLWNTYAANEYGFYANVNPDVDHPRWSQATEFRIGEEKRRPTLLFNAYDEVTDLYQNMDLSKDF